MKNGKSGDDAAPSADAPIKKLQLKRDALRALRIRTGLATGGSDGSNNGGSYISGSGHPSVKSPGHE